MTKTEQAELEELGTTAEALSAKTAQMEALVNGESKLDRELKASIALVDSDPFAKFKEEYPPARPQRNKPIKGKCVNCGKHYSRHHRLGLEAWCFADHKDELDFSLKGPKIAQQPPTKLSALIEKVRGLYALRTSRIAQLEGLKNAQESVQYDIDRLDMDIEAVYAEMLKGE